MDNWLFIRCQAMPILLMGLLPDGVDVSNEMFTRQVL
jgi:hypothetical protein